MNTNYKLLVTDIDGTLADRNGNISAIDLKAVQDIHRAGVNVSICTGRAASGCRKILDQLNFDGLHIFFDGALVTDSQLKANIYMQAIDPELVSQAIKLAGEHDLEIELFPRKGFYIARQNVLSDKHSQLLNLSPSIADLEVIKRQEAILLACIVVPTSDEKRVIALCSELKKHLNITATTHPGYPEMRFINVSNKQVSKGEALKALMSHLSLRPEETIALGDGANDIPLLENAGLAVAMQNAPEALKKVADYITEDVDHNGLANVIKRFF
jgi:Cof subfamily protein (haloacid dehalogenase superfamily)